VREVRVGPGMSAGLGCRRPVRSCAARSIGNGVMPDGACEQEQVGAPGPRGERPEPGRHWSRRERLASCRRAGRSGGGLDGAGRGAAVRSAARRRGASLPSGRLNQGGTAQHHPACSVVSCGVDRA
jgi:hypothetical protein